MEPQTKNREQSGGIANVYNRSKSSSTFNQISKKESLGVSSKNTTNFRQNHGKILIVDDEKFNCDIIEGFLLILGFKDREKKCVFAYNGEQAVNLI